MAKAKRLVGWICIFLGLVILFSSVFLAVETHHDCVGEGCQVCVVLRHVQALIQKMTHVALAAVVVWVDLFSCGEILRDHRAEHAKHITPVTLKVKLSN